MRYLATKDEAKNFTIQPSKLATKKKLKYGLDFKFNDLNLKTIL